ncbi:MAG TPA: hypothetical protein VG273_10355 [Bryobacteraceae bacterium]|jgi:hypothetical protein|nr:hypothetical protein [Bryobacteraceae bacterium]
MALTIEVLRPDDLLSLTIEAQNLKLDISDPKKPMLVVDDKSSPAFLVVTFPPQSITEKAYFEVGNVQSDPSFNNPPPTPPLGSTDDKLDPAGQTPSRMAGASRLVFQLPKKLTKIPYQLKSLLDWSQLTLVISTVAQGTPSPQPITAPDPAVTAIEIPYRLILSPGKGVAWVNATAPVTHSGRTELWHTRLAKIVKTTKNNQTTTSFLEASLHKTIPLRAIWSPDFKDHQALPDHTLDVQPFRSALSPRDRAQLVVLTSGTNGYYVLLSGNQPGPWTPTPIHASRLFLSALGAWLSSRGNWFPLPVYNLPLRRKLPGPVIPVRPAAGPHALQLFETVALDLTEWDHLATEGRDHYVKVVYEGFLYPFGHAATLVKVTERKFVPAEDVPAAPGFSSSVTAILRQHMYIVVREPEKTYDPSGYIFAGREMPFHSSIRIDTKVTPDIDPPPQPGDPGFFSQNSFWVTIDKVNFQFHCTGQDLSGAKIDFLAPMIFVSVSENDVGAVPPGVSDANSVKANYVKGGFGPVSSVHGKKVAYADPSAGDTILKTSGLFFDTQITGGFPFATAPFIPLLSQAQVTVPSVEELLGVTTPVDIQFYARYLNSGLDPNAGVFVDVLSASGGSLPQISFSANKSGGFATPGFTITALSARKGMVAGSADDAANGLIDPSMFFGGLSVSPKLFGTIPLGDLIPVDNITHKAVSLQNAPEVRSKELPNSKQPTQVVTTVKWEPDLTDYSLDPIEIKFNSDGNNSKLSLKAELTRPLDGAQPQSSITGSLDHFEITLLGVVAITVNSISFSSINGSKTNVVMKLASKNAIQFIGPLHFIQTLADILPPGLFGGKGPSIDLTATALKVSYTLGLPSISIGVFSLDHISITAGVDLPYLDGKPGFEFAFAKRSSPFLLTVECLGGGGFVHLVLTADGIQMVEGALEFGGEFSIDLGVASGAVHIMAGIYFQLAGSDSTLTGFVDIGGEVSVLGIISISIDLNLSLSFIHSSQGDKIQGRATLTISVSVLFFSISVSVSVERSFGSGSGDPKIADVISDKNWQDYCLAFAG